MDLNIRHSARPRRRTTRRSSGAAESFAAEAFKAAAPALCVAVLRSCKKRLRRETAGVAGARLLPRILCVAQDGDAATETIRAQLSAHAQLSFVSDWPITRRESSAAAAATLALEAPPPYDAIILAPPLTLADAYKSHSKTHSLLVGGGWLFAVDWRGDGFEGASYTSEWHAPERHAHILYARHVSVGINERAGPSWIAPAAERAFLERHVVVQRFTEELRGRFLSQQAHAKAVAALRDHGVCIIPDYFPEHVVHAGGVAAVRDVQEAAARIWREHSIKLLPHPQSGAPFDEYAKKDSQFVRGHGDKFTLKRGGHLARFCSTPEHVATNGNGEALASSAAGQGITPLAETPESTSMMSVENMLRHDPGILSVLEEACLPPATAGDPVALDDRKVKTMLRRSSSLLESHALGAVVSLPGKGKTKDQTIHVDAEHLYEHSHLPPHYLVMFLPALGGGAGSRADHDDGASSELAFEVGQTAFVVGSHRYNASQRITRDGKAAAQ